MHRHPGLLFALLILVFTVVSLNFPSFSPIADPATPIAAAATPIPTVPTNLHITNVTPTTISLAWSPSTESGGAIVGYKLYRNGAQLVNSSQPSFTNISLVPGASYTYTVASFDMVSKISGQSSSVGATTPLNTTPTPTVPANLHTMNVTPTTISLAWSPSTESGGAIVGYKLYRNGAQLVNSSQPSFTNISLVPGTKYTYTVAAFDMTSKISGQSPAMSVTTLPAQSSGLDYKVGFAVGENLMSLPTATLNQYLDDIVALGVGQLRFDISWDHTQPDNSSSFSWGDIDTFVNAAVAHHLKLLALVGYTPQWAKSPSCTVNITRCPPADPAQFATFVKAAVARYTPKGVTEWEVWNEPNLHGLWEPASDPAGYATLLRAVYPAIKSVNPNAIVITGGMAPTANTSVDFAPIDFLSRVYAAGGKGYFDAVGDHPYSFPAMPAYVATWNAWQQMGNTSPSLRSVMNANGDSGKQIWLTEYGAPTGGPRAIETSANDTQFIGGMDHVTEALQGIMLSSAITLDANTSWAGPIFLHQYKDIGTDPSKQENWFGIRRFDGSAKPAYSAIKSVTLQ